jgi:chromosome segregation protein
LTTERQAFESAPVPITVVGAAGTAGSAAEVRGELRTLRVAVERASAEVARNDQRLVPLDDKLRRLAETIEQRRRECERATGGDGPLGAEWQTTVERRRGAGETVEAADAAWRAAVSDRDTWTARADALALALDSARARAGAERLSGIEGVLGTLLDVVEVDDGWAAAFEAAAGEALSAVVVDNGDNARRALDALHLSATTGAVLALGTTAAPAGPIDVGEPVRRHVRAAEPHVERLLDALVGGVVAVDTWPAAVDAVLAHPGAVVVTLGGDRFGVTGWRVGSGATGATGAALDEARTRGASAAAETQRQAHALDLARAELTAAANREDDLVRRLDAVDAAYAAATEALARAQIERREALIERDALAEARDEMSARLAREQGRLGELEALLPGLEAAETAEAEAVRARQTARAALDDRATTLAAGRRDLAARTAGLDERRGYLTRTIAEVDTRLAADAAARQAAVERQRALADHLGALARLSALVTSHREALESVHSGLSEQRRRQSEQARAVAAHLDATRRARAEAEQRLDATRERARRAELDEAEVKLRLEAAVETLRRDLDVEPEAAMAAVCPPLPDGATASGRARELERELRIMGPINPLALEEFNALQERHQFLETQLEDVKATRRDLVRVINAVDNEIQNVFAAAYADVSEHFARLFETLFPGGTGRLVLTDPENLLATGIEVEAKPSGKNVKKLSLLSGGERSLTALAFLFAVFRSRPSPFYVMDEVEAALDDINLHRFLNLLAEFRDEAQLLVVSHQKRTMDAADCLYGVTMQAGGSSKVVSERVGADA